MNSDLEELNEIILEMNGGVEDVYDLLEDINTGEGV